MREVKKSISGHDGPKIVPTSARMSEGVFERQGHQNYLRKTTENFY